jgi:hypothetical protein
MRHSILLIIGQSAITQNGQSTVHKTLLQSDLFTNHLNIYNQNNIFVFTLSY